MPIDYFDGDFNLACSVMTVLPTMTNLRSAKVSLDMNGRIKNGVSLNFYIYGFKLELQTDNSRFNDDGIYLQYSIMYDGTSVGFVDYYYNYETHRFTYRQSVLCTFAFPPSKNVNNLILNLEYKDVEVKNPLSPEFAAGQLKEDGYLNDDALIDRFSFGDKWYDGRLNDYAIENPWFIRTNVTTKEVRDKYGDYITYSFLQPDSVVEASGNSWIEMNGYELADVMKKYATVWDDSETDERCKYLIDTDVERENADIKMIFEILPFMYETGSSIVTHHSKGSGGYESYSEFIDDSYNLMKQEFLTALGLRENIAHYRSVPNPIAYNSTKKLGAAAQKGENHSGMKFSSVNVYDESNEYKPNDDSIYKEKEFNIFYGEYDSEENTLSVEEFLIRKHLEHCGITNESYINNFIKVYCEWEKQPDGYNHFMMEKVKAGI